MRKPVIFKDNCDDELPWTCCYEDDESNVEWTEGRFYIGFGKTPIEAYEDWDKKRLERYLQGVLIESDDLVEYREYWKSFANNCRRVRLSI